MMRFDEYYDVVIIGTGAAGLYCALNFPKRYKVLLLTKGAPWPAVGFTHGDRTHRL